VNSYVGQCVAAHRAGGGYLVGEAGEQLVHDLPSAYMKSVHMPVLRHTLPVLAETGEPVAFDQSDPLVMVG
jgi:hypothetical protein